MKNAELIFSGNLKGARGQLYQIWPGGRARVRYRMTQMHRLPAVSINRQ